MRLPAKQTIWFWSVIGIGLAVVMNFVYGLALLVYGTGSSDFPTGLEWIFVLIALVFVVWARLALLARMTKDWYSNLVGLITGSIVFVVVAVIILVVATVIGVFPFHFLP